LKIEDGKCGTRVYLTENLVALQTMCGGEKYVEFFIPSLRHKTAARTFYLLHLPAEKKAKKKKQVWSPSERRKFFTFVSSSSLLLLLFASRLHTEKIFRINFP